MLRLCSWRHKASCLTTIFLADVTHATVDNTANDLQMYCLNCDIIELFSSVNRIRCEAHMFVQLNFKQIFCACNIFEVCKQNRTKIIHMKSNRRQKLLNLYHSSNQFSRAAQYPFAFIGYDKSVESTAFLQNFWWLTASSWLKITFPMPSYHAAQ